MAGIYLHIPFCKQACSYCNFHFSTSLQLKSALLAAMHKELIMRSHLFVDQEIASIYFGGGTPSLLDAREIADLLDAIATAFNVSSSAEITLEANPDDLTFDKLSALRNAGINRLSIGIQSFAEDDLRYMHRAHSVTQAEKALDIVTHQGWENVTVDLIYGTPGLTDDQWLHNLKIVSQYGIPHVSTYQLTIEEGTALHAHIRQKKTTAPDDGQIFRQYQLLAAWADENAYEHYEISNLAKDGHRAVHNSNYWSRAPYLGIGPSAHSFRGSIRSWNVANNPKYLKMMDTGCAIESQETLSDRDVYNETIMTGLRLIEGVSLDDIRVLGEAFAGYFKRQIQRYIDDAAVIAGDGRYKLSRDGRLFADRIASDCFLENAIELK